MIGDIDNFCRGGFLETIKDETTGKARPIYETQDPDLFLQVSKNNDPSGGSGSWKGRIEFAVNGIQRLPDIDESGRMYDWCKENKHTKLLCLSPQPFGALQQLRTISGEPSEYDICYNITGTGRNTSHSIFKADVNQQGVVIGELSAEEAAYERYGLEEATKLSPSIYVLKYLTETITKISQITNSKS